MRRLLLPTFLLLALVVDALGTSWASDWSGTWSTQWRDGGARMNLQQDGDQVTGNYTPQDGRIEARVDGNQLIGRWIEPGAEGGLEFTLAPNGRTFTGRFDNGEWWTGELLDDTAQAYWPRHADSPREVIRITVAALNSYRDGHYEAVNPVLALLDFGADEPAIQAQVDRTRRLFDVLDLLTFRLWDIPDSVEPGTAEVQITLEQAGTDLDLTLALAEEPGEGWRLIAPPERALEMAYQAMLEARGEEHVIPGHHLTLPHPRGTMRTFLEGLHNWDNGGREQVATTLDLSDLPPRLRDFEIDLLTDYLLRIIDRVGYITWQELPDDPDQRRPYVHFSHPVGEIAIAPIKVTPADGVEGEPVVRWLFTTETLRDLPALYDAVQDLDPPPGLSDAAPLSRFFMLREQLREIEPRLIRRDFVHENWQWIGLAILLVGGILLGLAVKGVLLRAIQFYWRDAGEAFRRDTVRWFAWPLKLLIVGLIWFIGVQNLGLPGNWFQALGTISLLLAAIGATWLLHNLIRAAGAAVSRRADKLGQVGMDDVFSSLGADFLRFVVLIFGVIVIADILGLPYEGVIASIGIGGLAFAIAGRETVANFFGAATLLADRPFRKGDFVEVGGQYGTIEMVGLRSTQIRALDDSVMVYPNGKLADSNITNLGRRRRRQVILDIGLTYDTSAAKLDRFVDRLHETFLARPNAVDDPLWIGVKKFGESSIDIQLIGYFTVNTYGDHVKAQHALVLDIIRLAEDQGVSFAFPTRTVHVQGPGDQASLAKAAE
jgi:small-conductance mechanosensitive channel